jgi:hypothetical protein
MSRSEPTNTQIFHSVYKLYMVAPTGFGITLPSSGSIPSARHNTPIHNILSTAPQLSISLKVLRMLPDDGNVMLKHVGATIHN